MLIYRQKTAKVWKIPGKFQTIQFFTFEFTMQTKLLSWLTNF